ncbi:unnamed protein product [Caenorhabditis sp. 36 PRJEB53466]|nr:unnamed protein product [Caenorhabditis sp. 36 PRJEB53466]
MVYVMLNEKRLWKEFDSQCNEMIITKIGRNLFPILEYTFFGLQNEVNYQVGITMQPTGRHKLKFTAGHWDPLDVIEEMFQPNEVFMAKPVTGRELMNRGLKLDKLKLTNTKEALVKSDQMIRVQSMRQYVPVLSVYELIGDARRIGTFQFQETRFIAVTAYQSDKVKNLKVQRNKFAQGFREGTRSSSAKRPTSTTSSTSPDSTMDSSSDNSDVSASGRHLKPSQFPSTDRFLTPANFGAPFLGPEAAGPFPTPTQLIPFQFDPNWASYYHQNHHQVAQQSTSSGLSAIQYDYSNPFANYHWPG